jgi:hypothetical protein
VLPFFNKTNAVPRERRQGKEEFGDMAEIQELERKQRKLAERVIERAEADPEWKRQYIEDPPTALGDMPEAQRLWEMDESVRPPEQPPEATMVTPIEEYKQLLQSLTEKVLDRAATDPLWKQRLLDDAPSAMREAGFLEVKRLDEIRQEEEVRGHLDLMSLDAGTLDAERRCRPYYTCYNRTYYYAV